MANIEKIKTYSLGFYQFRDVVEDISGGATPLGADYPESGIPFLRVQNIMQNRIDDSDVVFISEKDDQELSRSRLKENDVLLTITGVSYGKSAVVTKQNVGSNINQHSVRIAFNRQKLNPFFVATFLNAKFGKLQSDRNVTGVTRPALDYQAIRYFLIPKNSREFQKQIEDIVKAAHQRLEQSKRLYAEAENLLLDELGLRDWQPPQETVAVKSFKQSFTASGRLDAEFYQPKFEEVENLIKSKSFLLLEDICSEINYGTVPTSDYTEDDSGTPYIKGMNLKNTFIEADNLDRITNTEDLPQKFYTQEGDIIISQMGTVGNCGVVAKEQAGFLFASFTIRVRLNDKRFNPRFVALYINNIATPYYLHRYIAQASVRQNTDLPTIRNLFVPLVDFELQENIANKLQNVLTTKNESKRLLETAKRAVEIAIEQDEQAARRFIENQL